MRRKDREITDIDKIETIIASARYMHLGMFDGEFPYIVPLHYGYQMENRDKSRWCDFITLWAWHTRSVIYCKIMEFHIVSTLKLLGSHFFLIRIVSAFL